MNPCAHCELWSDFGPSIIIALVTVAGVALGYLVQRVSERFAVRRAVRTLLSVFVVVVAFRVWFDGASRWALLPPAGVLVGLFHRRERTPNVFPDRD